MKKNFVNVVFNTSPKLLRNDRMADRDYLVVPMVMLTEGVHEGSAGAYLYTPEETSKRVELWNMKPIVVYHPETPSACTPEVLNNRQIGVIMNTTWDPKEARLKAEAWLEASRITKVDKRIQEAIDNENTLELSTGLFADSDETEGEWKGEKFKGTLFNFGPDHLAILPDQKGACSIADGAGFYLNKQGEKKEITPSWSKYFNELSMNVIREQLSKLINDGVKGYYRFVEDIFDSYFIWSDESVGLHKREYTIEKEKVGLKGIDVAVVRKVDYVPVKNKEYKNMDKKVIVDGLIAKGVWNEADRERLMGMDEDVLKKMIPPAAPETPKQNVQAPAMTVVEKKEDVTSTTAKTLDEYLADMPEAIRSTVKNAMAMEKAEKARLIDIITANKKNTFTAEWLGTQELEMLKNLASLAAVEKDTKPIELGNYGLQLDPVQNVDGVPVLEVPVLKSK